MRIERVLLRELHMQLLAPFETSFGKTQRRRILLIQLWVDDVVGWGEVTAGETPGYSPETTDTAWHVLCDFIWPAVRDRHFADPQELTAWLEPIRGHHMAKAGLETAVWDAVARSRSMPLWKLLGGTQTEIAAGVSIGIQPSVEMLLDKIATELAAGYRRIKIKIRPGWDVHVCAAVRERFPEIPLMVDANSAYRWEDLPRLQELDQFNLMMIEQPLAWDDIYSHSLLQRHLRTPICLDECIHNLRHARAAVELGACRIINMKLGRVGGYGSACQIHAYCQQRGVPLWCGGMLESGIGRAHNIALSTLPNFSLPGDVSASRRYWEQDIVEPSIDVTPAGTIRAPEKPGIGFQPRLDLIDRLTVRQQVLS
jgi:O-succinylbenzoate synthase